MSQKKDITTSTFVGRNEQAYCFQLNLSSDWNYCNYENSPLHISTSQPDSTWYYQSASVYYYLNPTIDKWFSSYDAAYTFDYNCDSRRWVLEIFDHDVALLYKIAYT